MENAPQDIRGYTDIFTVYSDGCCRRTVQIVTGVVVGALLLIATVIVIIVVYRKSGYSI